MKEFYTKLLYIVLGIILGATVINTSIPVEMLIIVAIGIICGSIWDIMLRPYLKSQDIKEFERNTLELIVPAGLILGGTWAFVSYLDAIYSTSWINDCALAVTLIIVIVPLAILLVLMDFLHMIFMNYIRTR